MIRTDAEAPFQSTTRRVVRSGDEVAAFTSERRELSWKPGERRAVRTRANRRERYGARVQLARYTTV